MMLNYLERSGTFKRQNEGEKKHHGKARLYTFRDIVILRAINRLLKIGARPKRISEAIKTFSQIVEIPRERDQLLEFANSAALFVVTAEQVIFCKNTNELIDLANGGQLAFSFMIDVKASILPTISAMVEFSESYKAGHMRWSSFVKVAAKHNI